MPSPRSRGRAGSPAAPSRPGSARSRATRRAAPGSTAVACSACGGAWKWRIAAERLDQHALELGQRGDLPACVAHRRQVANLGEGEEPLVLGVRSRPCRGTGRRPRRRRQPLEREVGEPPELQAVGHHRDARRGAAHPPPCRTVGPPEGEDVDGGHPAPARRLRDREDHPVEVCRQLVLAEQRPEPLRHSVCSGGSPS